MEENGEKKNNRNQKQRRRHAHNVHICLIIHCSITTCRRRCNIDLEDLHFRFGYRDKIAATTLTAIHYTKYIIYNRRVSSGIENIAVRSVTMAIPWWR